MIPKEVEGDEEGKGSPKKKEEKEKDMVVSGHSAMCLHGMSISSYQRYHSSYLLEPPAGSDVVILQKGREVISRWPGLRSR